MDKKLAEMDGGQRLTEARRNHHLLGARDILIESLARFYTQFTGRNHIGEQGAGGIFRITQSLVHHLEDAAAGIETDEISQLQGTHGVGHSQFHDGINFLYTGNALV